MKILVTNPNLSVIMPVGCNAKCQFCYWKKQEGLTSERFQFVCDTLPEVFQSVSITGGEPTLSNNLSDYLKIAKNRFNKVVLNTNGFALTKKHFEDCDFVNISRHHYDDSENNKIFGTSNIPDKTKLIELCSYGDVTLNCFLPDGFSDNDFINKYILFAKEMGTRVAFRKYFNNLNLLEDLDKDGETLINDHSCGACRHRTHIINDVYVTFKYSVQETCDAINGIYELILQSTGDLTFDWAGLNKLEYN